MGRLVGDLVGDFRRIHICLGIPYPVPHLRYVAHSMGMTALFVMLHNEPYRNSQISRVTALAPVTGMVARWL